MHKVPTAFAVVAATLLAAGCGGATAGTATQQSNFYSGKTVSLIVPNAPGGPMDAAARLVAPYIKKYSGADAVNVDTVKGAGGVIGLNKLAASPADGTTIGFTSAPTVMLTSMVGDSSVKYDGTKFVFLGRLSTAPRVLVAAKKTGIKSLADLAGKSQQFKYPAQGFDDDFYTMAALGDTLGFNVKYVTGFGSQGEANQSIVVGSTDIEIGGLDALDPLIKSGDAVPLVMISDKRVSEYPNVPTWLEKVPSNEKQIATAFNDMISLERSFFAPAGFDSKATTAMRSAIDKAEHDKDLIAAASQQHLPIVFLSGSDEQKQVDLVHQQSTFLTPILQKALTSVKK